MEQVTHNYETQKAWGTEQATRGMYDHMTDKQHRIDILGLESDIALRTIWWGRTARNMPLAL